MNLKSFLLFDYYAAFLQALSWLAISISPSNIPILIIFIYLFLCNFGASITEVANEAIVAEMGKQTPPSTEQSQRSSTGNLHSFVWKASAVGGILGHLFTKNFSGHFPPQFIFLLFGLLLSLQFLITISVRETSLGLPNNPSLGMRQQLSELWTALRRPEIAYPISWFAFSYAIIPALSGTMFFYQTQYLKINSSILAMSKLFGQVTMLIWGIVYDKYLKSVPSRKLIPIIQAILALSMISDHFFVRGFYREMGVADTIYVVIFSGFFDVLFFFKILPFKALIAQQCPPGCEGSIMAFLASAISLAFIVGEYLGVFLASRIKITASDFSGLPLALVIQATCTLLPLFWFENTFALHSVSRPPIKNVYVRHSPIRPNN